MGISERERRLVSMALRDDPEHVPEILALYGASADVEVVDQHPEAIEQNVFNAIANTLEEKIETIQMVKNDDISKTYKVGIYASEVCKDIYGKTKGALIPLLPGDVQKKVSEDSEVSLLAPTFYDSAIGGGAAYLLSQNIETAAMTSIASFFSSVFLRFVCSYKYEPGPVLVEIPYLGVRAMKAVGRGFSDYFSDIDKRAQGRIEEKKQKLLNERNE